VKLAVKLGTSAEVRNEAESRIKSSVHKLYESLDSIRAWDKVFLDIAPVAIDESWRTGNDEL
jgi:hypothetical protein